jgi:hypothetical protein
MMARPLEKMTKGKLYTRPPAIEAATDAALAQDLATQRRRALIRDRHDPEYLPSESLVHLIREAMRRCDDAARDSLLPLLLARCEANLNAKVDGQIPGAVELREDILGEFAELFAIDGSPDDKHELDFFEVRFNRAFFTFRATRVRSELDHLSSQTPLPEPSDEIELIEQELDDEVLARISDLQGVGANPEDRLFRKQIFDAIKALPTDQRNAVVLVYLLGFKQGSENPDETTAATLCGVDVRTIQNRLRRAFATLSKLQEVA